MKKTLIIASLTVGLAFSAVAKQQEQGDSEFYDLRLTVSEQSKKGDTWQSIDGARIGCGKAFEGEIRYSFNGDKEKTQTLACSSFSQSSEAYREDGKYFDKSYVFIPKDERTLITGSEVIHVFYESSECGTMQFEVPWLARGEVNMQKENSDGSCSLALNLTPTQS